jgi:Lrp/AsnC family leucine-responsive transcriptional regulator
MESVKNIDKIDKKIMNFIQKDPNITHTELAKRVGRSQPTIGIRVKKLEKLGMITYQAGINLKDSEFYFSKIDVETSHPDEICDIVEKCPFMLAAFRLSGKTNLNIIAVNPELLGIEKVVNYYLRDRDDILNLSVNLITKTTNNIVLPLNLDFKICKDCKLNNYCSKYN